MNRHQQVGIEQGATAQHIADGFPGQRMRVLPRPLVAQALQAPITSHLLVTDVGWFPRAQNHWRARPRAREHIVIFCAAGQGLANVAGRHHDIEPGQVLVIPAGAPHQYQALSSNPWSVWWLHLRGSDVPALVAATGATVDKPVLAMAEPARVATLVNTILRRMETDETAASLVASAGAAWHLMATVAADRRALSWRSTDDPIGEVIDYIRANVAQQLVLRDLAAMAGFSTSHFSALFRRATGYGVLEYQTRLRMGWARELLDTTDRTISSIAREVGYGDAMYFSRQFRRIHHLSPTSYRLHEWNPGGVEPDAFTPGSPPAG